MPSAPPDASGLPGPQPQPIPSPSHQLRPPATRAATLGTLSSFKARATSQPPGGDRIPSHANVNTSQPGSGRASPGGTNGNGGAFGVIGGSRTPGRFGGGLPGPSGMRAMSFSAAESRGVGNTKATRTLSSHAEELPSRSSQSTSPFPTFSPSSSLSGSPAHFDEPLPHPHSPPRAEANVSRSRSQSLAGGPRPTATERFPMMPMSALGNAGAFPRSFEKGWSPPETSSNMSPFARGMPILDSGVQAPVPSDGDGGWRARAKNTWDGPTRDSAYRSPLSSSVARALGSGFGAPSYSTVVGGFDNNVNGGKSGSSSRRHSVSVVGGVGGRRDLFGDGGGMSAMTSPPGPGRGLGPSGLSDEDLLPERLGNALNLEIDENRRRGIDIELKDGLGRGGREIPISQSLPRFEPIGQRDSGFRSSFGGGVGGGSGFRDSLGPDIGFGTSPARGRPEQLQTSAERAASGDSKEGSAKSRFSFETHSQAAPGGGAGGASGFKGPNVGNAGNAGAGGRGEPPAPPGYPARGGPGHIGGPAGYDPRLFGGPPPPGPFGGPPYPGNMYQGRPPYSGGPPTMGGPPSPNQPFGRPPAGYPGFYGAPPGPQSRQQPMHYGGGPGGFSASAAPFQPQGGGGPPPPPPPPFYPQSPTSPNPNSPSSFSQLSLADLGKGIPLGSLPPNTPLYVVTFKAGRRDVFYCPDPTLLISNGDRVIVEADRGSDLGTVVYDQLTPLDVREWQEKQATAALLSGASQHQPPGMAVAAQASPPQNKPKVLTGELAGVDLATLLAGVGPGGQLDLGQTIVRGPLAKEIMPKRIFAKSSQGPEEQARMLDKLRDEHEALMICRDKVAQRGLPMAIVDAEYQWDRRKLTFYFKADKRVDFRDLTKENFRIFKSRIWMSMVPKDDPRN